MEKLIYLVWLEADTPRDAVADLMLGSVAPGLLALGPHRLSMDLRDAESDIPAPVPTPEGETPLHALVSVWLDAVDHRQPYQDLLAEAASTLAGYQVVESLYRGLRREPVVGATGLGRWPAVARACSPWRCSSSIPT